MFNVGYFVAIKRSGAAGGAVSLLRIDGSGSQATRGLASGIAPLQIFYPTSTPTLPSPVRSPMADKFDSAGLASIVFLWDAASVPRAITSRSGILATRCSYQVKIGSATTTSEGGFLHFSNVGDFARASPHFRTPSIPVPAPKITSAIDSAVTKARRYAAIVNSMSRQVLLAVAIC